MKTVFKKEDYIQVVWIILKIILPKPGTKNRYYYFSLEDYLGKNFAFSPHVLCTEVEYRKDSVVPFIVLGKICLYCAGYFSCWIYDSDQQIAWWWLLDRHPKDRVMSSTHLTWRRTAFVVGKKVIGEHLSIYWSWVAAFGRMGRNMHFTLRIWPWTDGFWQGVGYAGKLSKNSCPGYLPLKEADMEGCLLVRIVNSYTLRRLLICSSIIFNCLILNLVRNLSDILTYQSCNPWSQ